MGHTKKDGLHEFALWYALLNRHDHAPGASVVLTRDDICQRIVRVLRRRPGDSIILFDDARAVRIVLDVCEVTVVRAHVLNTWLILPRRPLIDLYLPVLERDAFEHSVTMATIFGVTNIYPIVTEKTHRIGVFNHAHERLSRLMHAASEQSKQFMLPQLHPVRPLTEIRCSSPLMVLAYDGSPAAPIVESAIKRQETICCIVGPEGDFTTQERLFLESQKICTVSLGLSMLRSEIAVTVLLGLIRSYDRSCSQEYTEEVGHTHDVLP